MSNFSLSFEYNYAKKKQSPIIIKNDSVDRAIYDAEQEISNRAKTISLDKAYTELEKNIGDNCKIFFPLPFSVSNYIRLYICI